MVEEGKRDVGLQRKHFTDVDLQALEHGTSGLGVIRIRRKPVRWYGCL